jgi:hypothetical protein
MAERRSLFVTLLEALLDSNPGKAAQPSPNRGVSTISQLAAARVATGSRAGTTGRPIVTRNFSAVWQDKGWQRRGSRYTGYYRTPFGAYEGYIDERYRGGLEFYIKDAPDCLKLHSHRACFWPKGKGLLYVHFSRAARTPDEGIMAIERILTEAHQIETRTTNRRR